MATEEKKFDGETYYYALVNPVIRGNLYGASSNDGKSVHVYHGSPLGYPMGDTVLTISKEHIPDLIATLTAVIKDHK